MEFVIHKFRGQPCQQVLALRVAGPGDIPALDALQQRVMAGMSDPEWFVPADREALARQLTYGTFFCLWAGEELAAYLSLLYEGEGEENYARDMGLPQKALPLWANVDSVLVAPEYRGNGLMRQLLRWAEAHRRPEIIGFGCTVSPRNRYSRDAFAAEGFVPVVEKEKYGGHLRLVMQKPLLPLPGYYRHFKGGRYQVLGAALHSESTEEMVLYRALYGEGRLWVRPAPMWSEWVVRDGYEGPRFRYEGAAPSEIL